MIFLFKVVVVIVLNVSEDYMDRYDLFVDYCVVKFKIYNNVENVIVNGEDF